MTSLDDYSRLLASRIIYLMTHPDSPGRDVELPRLERELRDYCQRNWNPRAVRGVA